MCTNFQTSETTLKFWTQICPNLHQFSDKTNNIELLGPNLPKNGFWGRNFKNLSLYWESVPPIYHVCQFSVKWTTFNFWPKFGEIAQLRAIFWFKYCWGCCRELGGDWNELGGAGWSWVEVDRAGWGWVHGLVTPLYN